MLDIKFRGLPHVLMGTALPPVGVNTNLRRQAPSKASSLDSTLPDLVWVPPAPSRAPLRPRTSRHHLTVVK